MFASEPKKIAAAQLFSIVCLSFAAGMFATGALEHWSFHQEQNWVQVACMAFLLFAVTIGAAGVVHKVK